MSARPDGSNSNEIGHPKSDKNVAVQLAEVRKSFGHNEVLKGVDLTICAGEVVAIIGPSGSGKSTLIRCINLLELPTSGRLAVNGQTIFADGPILSKTDLKALRIDAGMVFQSFNLFPTMTAQENITLAQIHARGRSKTEADTRSMELLESVGLADRADFRPAQLSGGQQQRVAIARALALDPKVMLFDEPTSAIDPELRVEVLRAMRNLAQTGMTMIIVTHEMKFAEQVADRVVFIADGNIVEQGPSQELLNNPQHDRTQRFLAAVEGVEL